MRRVTWIAVFLLLILSVCPVAAEDAYISMHNEAELTELLGQVRAYTEANEEAIHARLNETGNMIVTQALVRAWGITAYEDATAEQIDNAYGALFNAFLFLGLNLETADRLNGDGGAAQSLFLSAYELLDQDYFDLLAEAGESAENIEYAEYLRDIAEALEEDPNAFSVEETEEWMEDIYAELYYAAGIKALHYTDQLPLPEELYGGKLPGESADTAAAAVTVDSADGLTELLGIQMPDLSGQFGCALDTYAIVAEIVAEVSYKCEGGAALFRLAPTADLDISGVYNGSFYDDWKIYGTETEINTYQKMFIGKGTVQTHDGARYSFAVDTDELDRDTFEDILFYFIESCRNQTARN